MATDAASTYANPSIGRVYDALNALLWFPHGSGRLRAALVDSLRLRPGQRVLELGCGTGQVTERLAATGAEVTAVDRSAPMLARARGRVTGVEFVEHDVLRWSGRGSFEVVVLAFILHELPVALRRQLLDVAAGALAEGGRLAILEWSLPAGRLRRALWGRTITTLEPAPAAEVLRGTLDEELPAAGWEIELRRSVAGGRAQVLLAKLADG